MRRLQGLLLVVGNVVLGAVVVGAGLAMVSSITVFARNPTEHGTSTWGSFYGVIFALLFGSLFGSLIGLIHAVTVITRSEGVLWHRPTWLGIAVGLVLMLPIAFNFPTIFPGFFGEGSMLYEVLDRAVGRMVLAVLLAALGGYSGWILEVAESRRKARRQH